MAGDLGDWFLGYAVKLTLWIVGAVAIFDQVFGIE